MIITTMIMMIVTMLPLREDPTMMRNGCLTLCQFNIPQDVLFDYERLVKQMLVMVVLVMAMVLLLVMVMVMVVVI